MQHSAGATAEEVAKLVDDCAGVAAEVLDIDALLELGGAVSSLGDAVHVHYVKTGPGSVVLWCGVDFGGVVMVCLRQSVGNNEQRRTGNGMEVWGPV